MTGCGFALQAAIAAVHAEAPSYADTDWAGGARPVRPAAGGVALPGGGAQPRGRRRHGPRPSSRARRPGEVADDPHLATYPYLAATRADLLRRLGQTHDAAQAYRTALSLATNAAEQDFLTRRLTEVTAT